jgi:cytochrome c-type biogenesis protein CcmH
MGRTNDARAARNHVAAGEANAATANSGTADTTASAPPANPTSRQRVPDATPASRISGTVQIAPNLASSAAAGMTLFVYATDAASPGPPLAVRRLRVDHWPVSFVIDDADAMIPGRNLSAARRIQVEARVSASGEALPRPGDLAGKVENVDPHTTQPINISIDHKIN